MRLEADHRFNVRWLREERRILKPDGTIWVTGTHHIIFSLGFALQTMRLKIINQITWAKPDPPPNALHTAFTHAHETLLWASKERGARHTFNYDLINSRDPTSQISSVWRIPSVPMREKSHGRHPTQKPLRLVRRTILASTVEGDLVFDPFCGSGTTGVAAFSRVTFALLPSCRYPAACHSPVTAEHPPRDAVARARGHDHQCSNG